MIIIIIVIALVQNLVINYTVQNARSFLSTDNSDLYFLPLFLFCLFFSFLALKIKKDMRMELVCMCVRACASARVRTCRRILFPFVFCFFHLFC